MKIVQINTSCGIGSTGKICEGISKLLTANQIENYIIFSALGDGYPLSIQNSSNSYMKLQALITRILGNYGFGSKMATRKMIRTLEKLKPDIVHLHNLHGHDCNLKMLLDFLKKNNIKTVWTFHDCWAFTGYCPYFTMVGCEKWKTKCEKCPQWNRKSWFFDRSRTMFERKKRAAEQLDLTIVTPSQWLADITAQSFFKNQPIHVIHNGINLDIFKPRRSNFREKYCLENKFVLLGVAFFWGERKGLDVFVSLAKQLDERFQIVLVGTDSQVDSQIPSNIISIHRTKNQKELAEIYSAADLFVNPTREENYPTVNMEAIACGTPVLTFNTGGCCEMLDPNCGISVLENDLNDLISQIQAIYSYRGMSESNCVQKALKFKEEDCYSSYLKLYYDIIKKENQLKST